MNGVQCHPRPEIGRNSGSARRNQVGTRSESHWTKTSRNGTRTLPGSALSRNTTRQHHLDHVEPEPPPKLVPPGPTLIKFLLLTKMYSVKRCSSSERQRFRRKKGGTPVPLDGTSSEPVRNHLGTPLLSCITSSQPGSAFRNHLGTTSEPAKPCPSLLHSPVGIGFPRLLVFESYEGNVGMGPRFFPVSLIFNVVLWYLLSCLLSLGYSALNRVRSK